jgi:hypothetical protein
MPLPLPERMSVPPESSTLNWPGAVVAGAVDVDWANEREQAAVRRMAVMVDLSFMFPPLVTGALYAAVWELRMTKQRMTNQ